MTAATLALVVAVLAILTACVVGIAVTLCVFKLIGDGKEDV